MYIYGGNTCSVNNECESGYSLYFPCIKTITRGENSCFDFYIVDNATKEEVDLREIDDITLNLSGRYNCNFGSYSYPENIKSLQVEQNSNIIYDVNFSDIINKVKLYIDIVDENHNLIESHLYDENSFLDIAIDGNIGYFLKGHNSILNLNAYDTNTLMFLGWNIEEDDECDLGNIYDYLIDKRNLVYDIEDDCIIRVVYQKRREYTINMDGDNYNSSFIVNYMDEEYVIIDSESITVLEGHDVKVTCVTNDVNPYVFVKWDDGYESPYRVLHVGGDNLTISLKVICELNAEKKEYIDDIDANALNNFRKIYPTIVDSIFVDSYFINNMYVNNCEVDILNDTPYVKIIEGGNFQIDNINDIGNLKLSINNIGGDCNLFINNYEILPSSVERNEFIFEYEGGILTITGNDSCIFGLTINKEVIYQKGKCTLCLSSEDTLNFHPGDLAVDGGVIVNGNPYGLSSVNFAKVSNTTPLIIK
jgi:hypothetical protein